MPSQVVFAMDIDGRPTLVFEAKNIREASELCKEDWLRADLSVLSSNGTPLCNAAARLTTRRATEIEMQIYRDADREAQASDDLLLAYLVSWTDLDHRTKALPIDRRGDADVIY